MQQAYCFGIKFGSREADNIWNTKFDFVVGNFSTRQNFAASMDSLRAFGSCNLSKGSSHSFIPCFYIIIAGAPYDCTLNDIIKEEKSLIFEFILYLLINTFQKLKIFGI